LPLRWSRTGFEATEFPRRRDGPSNTLTIILNTAGKSFLFTLTKNTQLSRRRFTLKEERKAAAIRCDSKCGPHFGEIMVTDNSKENASGSMSGFSNRSAVIWKTSISVLWTFCTPLTDVFLAVTFPKKGVCSIENLLNEFECGLAMN
jgi:hypothetical protein